MSPLASMKPCPTKGCAALTRGGCCEAHRHDRQRAFDKTRPSAPRRGYGKEWQKTRLVILKKSPATYQDHQGVIRGQGPVCVMCLQKDRFLNPSVVAPPPPPATEVDHIDGNTANNDHLNLRPLCKSCHSRRTARDQGFARRAS